MSYFFESTEERLFKTAVKNFKEVLKTFAKDTSYLSYGNIQLEEIRFKNRTVVKGKNFLTSIQELMSGQFKTNYQFWADLLNAATKTLNTPHPDNFSQLYGKYYQLSCEWSNGKPWNKTLPAAKIVTSSIFIVAGTGGLALSSMYLHWIIWGSLSLAMGPWGAVALGVGMAFVSLVVACIAGYQLYKNMKICNDTPIEAITDFVLHIQKDPNISQQNSLEQTSNTSNETNGSEDPVNNDWEATSNSRTSYSSTTSTF